VCAFTITQNALILQLCPQISQRGLCPLHPHWGAQPPDPVQPAARSSGFATEWCTGWHTKNYNTYSLVNIRNIMVLLLTWLCPWASINKDRVKITCSFAILLKLSIVSTLFMTYLTNTFISDNIPSICDILTIKIIWYENVYSQINEWWSAGLCFQVTAVSLKRMQGSESESLLSTLSTVTGPASWHSDAGSRHSTETRTPPNV